METPVAAFDFDGTITRKDSFMAFIRYVKGDIRWVIGMGLLSPLMAAYMVGLISNNRAKEYVLAYFFKGESEQKMYEWGAQFYQEELHTFIRPAALDRIQWHQQQGHQCFLVTASFTFWTRAWAEANGLTLVATEPQIVEGKFTGKIQGENCYGPGKVKRLQALLAGEPPMTYAYGDTQGDRELLAWAQESRYRPFH